MHFTVNLPSETTLLPEITSHNTSHLPPVPKVRLEMMTPTEYTGALMDLGQTRRGIFLEMKYLTPERSTLIYEVGFLHMRSVPSIILPHNAADASILILL